MQLARAVLAPVEEEYQFQVTALLEAARLGAEYLLRLVWEHCRSPAIRMGDTVDVEVQMEHVLRADLVKQGFAVEEEVLLVGFNQDHQEGQLGSQTQFCLFNKKDPEKFETIAKSKRFFNPIPILSAECGATVSILQGESTNRYSLTTSQWQLTDTDMILTESVS